MELLILLAIGYALLPLVAIGLAMQSRSRLQRIDQKLGTLERQIADWQSSTVPPQYTEEPSQTTEPADDQLRNEDDHLTEPEEITEPEEPAEPEAPAETPDDLESMIAASVNASSDDETVQQSVPEKEEKLNLEDRIGTRWSTLLGGLTLAIGLVFLARHSIEAGLLGPGVRIMLGLAFSAALFLAGELLRRSDRRFNLPINEKADVPGILTGAAAIGAFATIYSAYALYGFIGPAIAFIALTIIGLLSLFLSAIHGPKLAALGILGSYGAPLLVSTDQPDPLALTFHLITVTLVVMTIARIRRWEWLAIEGAIASSLWVAIASPISASTNGLAGALLLIAFSTIFTVVFGWRSKLFETPNDEKTDRVAIVAFLCLTPAFFVQLVINMHLPETTVTVASTIIIMAGAAIFTNLAGISVAASVIAIFAILVSDLDLDVIDGLTTGAELANNLVPKDTTAFIINATILAVPAAAIALWASWRSANPAPRHAGWMASTVSTLAFFAPLAAYLRIAPFETRPVFGLIAVALAAGLSILTEIFVRKYPGDNTAPAPAAFAVGVISTVSFAIGVSLDVGWMPFAFSLTTLGISLVYLKRPVRILPWLSLAAALLAGVSLWFNLPLEMPDVSATPVLNGLLLLLLLPAVSLVAAGETLRRTGDLVTSAAITAIGLAIGALFVGLELTHLINGGDLKSSSQSLAETAAHALAAMGFAYGLQRVSLRTGASVYHFATYAMGLLSVAIIAIGLFWTYNPFLTGEPVGNGLVFNLLLPGYLLTGITAGFVALSSRGIKPRWYTLLYAALSGILLFAYFSLSLRKAFQGEQLSLYRLTSDLEFWLYSPLWLVLGGLILTVGIVLKSTPVRAASGLLIALTILKVFLLDMSELTGALRAFSFIGLGLSLIIIGRFYQRILLRSRSTPRPTAGEA